MNGPQENASNAPMNVPQDPALTKRPRIPYTDLWSKDGKDFVASVEDVVSAFEVRTPDALVWGLRLFLRRASDGRFCEAGYWRALVGRMVPEAEKNEGKQRDGS